jgi:hypothetical protein
MWFRFHTHKHQVSWTPGRVISPSQGTLPDNTQHSQETDIHASGRIRTHNPRRRAAANSRIKLRGHWDWQFPSFTSVLKLKAVCTVSIIMWKVTKGATRWRRAVGLLGLRLFLWVLPEVGLLISEADYIRLLNARFRSCSTAVLQPRALRFFNNLAHKHTKISGLLHRYFGQTKIQPLPRGINEKLQNTTVKTPSLSLDIWTLYFQNIQQDCHPQWGNTWRNDVVVLKIPSRY